MLEHRLGTALFNRSTRSVALTEAGARYLELVTPAIAELAAAQDEIGEAAVRPRGKLRIIAQRAAHMMVVQPLLGEFLAAYPEIDVEVVIDFGVNDMVMEGFDAGIRFGDIVEKDMVGVDIGPALSAHVLASPSYLSARGMPAHPNDLLRHDCIGTGHAHRSHRTLGVCEGERKAQPRHHRQAHIQRLASLTQAALDGLGITYMINGYVDRFIDQGRLVRLLEPWSPTSHDFGFTTPIAAEYRRSCEPLSTSSSGTAVVPKPSLKWSSPDLWCVPLPANSSPDALLIPSSGFPPRKRPVRPAPPPISDYCIVECGVGTIRVITIFSWTMCSHTRGPILVFQSSLSVHCFIQRLALGLAVEPPHPHEHRIIRLTAEAAGDHHALGDLEGNDFLFHYLHPRSHLAGQHVVLAQFVEGH